MEEKTTDRRVRRTRRLLKESLAELMEEKEFSSITVKDITERADLNRGTFYLHYADTYDLLEKLENETLADFQEMINAGDMQNTPQSLETMLHTLARYVVENESICRTLFENKASTDFFRKFQGRIRSNMDAAIRQSYPNCTDRQLDFFFAFVTYGLMGFLRQWFSEEQKDALETHIPRAVQLIGTAARVILT